LNNSNVKDILQTIGYTPNEFGRSFRCKPLYRDSDNATVLCVDKSTGCWYDFKEGIGGSLNQLVKLTLKLKSDQEAEDFLSEKKYIQAIEPQEEPLITLPKIFPQEQLKKLEPETSYWNKRGISNETLSIFKGGIALDGRMCNRYVFPIPNSKGETVGYSGRDLTNSDKRPKWKHIGHKKEWCYPLFFNKQFIADGKEAVMVESIGDMLALWEAGVKNSIVTFGLKINPKIISYLIKIDISKIIIALNNDNQKNFAGNKASNEMEEQLSNHFDRNQLCIALPSKKDFGEMEKEEIKTWKQNLKSSQLQK
jgi:DNA primase